MARKPSHILSSLTDPAAHAVHPGPSAEDVAARARDAEPGATLAVARRPPRQAAAAETPHQRRHRLDPDSRAWIDGLCARDGRRDEKLQALYDLMRRAARHEVARRRNWTASRGSKDSEDLVEEIAGDALLVAVRKLDSYRGESRFTTWAYAFVMNVTSAKLARRVGRPVPLSMEDRDWDRLPDRLSPDSHGAAELREILVALRSGVELRLTERQRRVFVAVALNDASIDALAEELGSNRNAIYKTLFEARRKLRVHLEAAGFRLTATKYDRAGLAPKTGESSQSG